MKFGNPQALRYTDHSSMAQKEAAIQRRAQASHETSTVLLIQFFSRFVGRIAQIADINIKSP